MAQSVSHRLLTVEAQVQSQTIPCDICSGCNVTTIHLVFSQLQSLPVQRPSLQSNPSDMSNGQPTDRATLRSTFYVRWSRLCCNFVTSRHLRPCRRWNGVQWGQLEGVGRQSSSFAPNIDIQTDHWSGATPWCRRRSTDLMFNPLTPNDSYSGCTAPLTSKRCILYIYSTNTGTEYFKHGIYCPFFFSSKCCLFHNSNVFGSCFITILYTGCAKI